jgi:hypothetical protein
MCSNRYSFHILMELLFSRWIFQEYSNMNFHGNPSSGNGWIDEQRDLTKQIVAYRNSAKEIKKKDKYFIISIVKRKKNSHYNCPPTIFSKSFWSYSKEIARTLTSDNISTVRCQCINFAVFPEASSQTLHTQLSPTWRDLLLELFHNFVSVE